MRGETRSFVRYKHTAILIRSKTTSGVFAYTLEFQTVELLFDRSTRGRVADFSKKKPEISRYSPEKRQLYSMQAEESMV